MSKIVFWGNSAASTKAIEEIRKKDTTSDISIVANDNCLSSKRHLFGSLISKEIKDEDVVERPLVFYDQNNISLHFNKKIIKADFKKNCLVSDQKEIFEFDILVLANVQTLCFPDIKGTHKTGVFSLRRLSELKDILAMLPLVETVILQISSIQGLIAACSFKQRGKEVILVVNSSMILSQVNDEDFSRVLMGLLEQKGIRIIKDNSISEILGEGEVKAIRLASGKVVSTQLVVLDQVKADLKLFANSTLEIEKKGVVDSYLRTNLKNVFAVDEFCQISQDLPWDDFEVSLLHLSDQGRVVGQNIVGDSVELISPFRYISFKLFDVSVNFIGESVISLGLKEYKDFNLERGVFKKILLENNIMVGAILINAADEEQKMLKLIQGKVDISNLECPILDRNNDFEKILSLKNISQEALVKESTPTCNAPIEDSAQPCSSSEQQNIDTTPL